MQSDTPAKVIIRDATGADHPAWVALWQDYLTFYDITLDPAVTNSTWTRIMTPDHALNCRLAWLGDTVLGFAIHLHHPSTWVMGDDCYLEDLFVSAAARGKGVGRALIKDLMALARTKGWHRLYWHTDEGNETARGLYDSFTEYDGHVRYRLTL
jgi:GNAT superfamily N-acetyltransferase